jgi:transcriptional regulator with XRE-family HTH domain
LITRKQLRNARKCCGYTQERMASALGYSLSYYKKIEEGFSDVPSTLEIPYLIEKIEKYHKSVLSTVTLILGGNFVKP